MPLLQQELDAMRRRGASAASAAVVAAAAAHAAPHQGAVGRLREENVDHQRLVGLGCLVRKLLAHEIDFRDVDLELGSCAEPRSAPRTARPRGRQRRLNVQTSPGARTGRAGPTHCASGDV